jgi:acyl-CoA synthetase (AMP-forming)/AMP-acid ligase II
MVLRNADRPAVLLDGASLSYRDLWAQSGRAAKAMIARGAKPGERIGSWSPNAIEPLIVQCAALRLGLVTLHLDSEWGAEQARAALVRAEVGCIFIRAFHQGRQYPAIIKSLRGQAGCPREVVIHGRQPRFERVLPDGWTEFLEAGDRLPDAVLDEREMSPDARTVIVFSGSGSSPSVALEECSILRAVVTGDTGRTYVDAPFHQPAGLVRGCLATLLNGGTIVLPGPAADSDTIVDWVQKSRCTALVLSRKAAAALREYLAARPEVRTELERCRITDDDGCDKLGTWAVVDPHESHLAYRLPAARPDAGAADAVLSPSGR